MSEKYKFMKLDWDTAYFGIPSSRVILLDTLRNEDWNNIVQLMNETTFNTIDNINNNSSNNLFISNLKNTFLTDINFQFYKDIDLKKQIVNYTNEEYDIEISNYVNEDQEILEISKTVYKHSRFFNDPFLNKDKTKDIYLFWSKNAFDKDNKYFLKIKNKNLILGYVLFNLNSEDSSINIELIAVHEKYQKIMLGNIMLKNLEHYINSNFPSMRSIKVGTQGNNINAINFYFSNGFKVKELRTIYHFWNNN